MQPVKVSLQPHTRGDTWEGIASIGPILINGAPPPNPLGSVRMHFRLRCEEELGYALSSEATQGEGSIVIDDAAAWSLHVPEQVLPLSAGTWDWDLEFTDSAGRVATYYAGQLVITQDITR